MFSNFFYNHIHILYKMFKFYKNINSSTIYIILKIFFSLSNLAISLRLFVKELFF